MGSSIPKPKTHNTFIAVGMAEKLIDPSARLCLPGPALYPVGPQHLYWKIECRFCPCLLRSSHSSDLTSHLRLPGFTAVKRFHGSAVALCLKTSFSTDPPSYGLTAFSSQLL
ncbi:hypothetical protein FCM35_KLT12885 [Carex littledalei]|uniref:Uncharacterized protein n=1 Tax=Carex littledalei TaxID=544730 RepID=A0A833QNN3_9POAL|nr:hypothetical protein FCM35_KLT12885 [Carex littledalei]